MSQILLDSNLIVYAAQPHRDALQAAITREAPFVSVVSKVETLGYPELAPSEEQFLAEFFDAANVLPISPRHFHRNPMQAATPNVTWGCIYRGNGPESQSSAGHPQHGRFSVD